MLYLVVIRNIFLPYISVDNFKRFAFNFYVHLQGKKSIVKNINAASLNVAWFNDIATLNG